MELLEQYIKKVITGQYKLHKELITDSRNINSRVILLKDLTVELNDLPVDISDYFKEAISTLQSGFTRSSIVFSWAGFFHVFCSGLYNKYESMIRAERPKWKLSTLAEFKDYQAESNIIDIAKVVGFINKNELKIYQGNLAIRNQCAHPTLYKPMMNQAIAFVEWTLINTKQYL